MQPTVPIWALAAIRSEAAHIRTRTIAALHPAPGDRRNVEQGPACGMRPWSRSRARRSNADLMRVSGVRSPEGPLFRPTTRHPSTKRLEPAQPSAGAGVRDQATFWTDDRRYSKTVLVPRWLSALTSMPGTRRSCRRKSRVSITPHYSCDPRVARLRGREPCFVIYPLVEGYTCSAPVRLGGPQELISRIDRAKTIFFTGGRLL
jgi:hypothetical protein